MSTLTMPRGTANYIISEANNNRSRDEGVVTGSAGGALVAGTILGRLTATKKLVRLVAGASDGSQTPAGILFEGVPVGATDHVRTFTARDSEVTAAHLVYPAGSDAAAKAAINAGLATLGIIARA